MNEYHVTYLDPDTGEAQHVVASGSSIPAALYQLLDQDGVMPSWVIGAELLSDADYADPGPFTVDMEDATGWKPVSEGIELWPMAVLIANNVHGHGEESLPVRIRSGHRVIKLIPGQQKAVSA
jgi:hypothetical protein